MYSEGENFRKDCNLSRSQVYWRIGSSFRYIASICWKAWKFCLLHIATLDLCVNKNNAISENGLIFVDKGTYKKIVMRMQALQLTILQYVSFEQIFCTFF